MSFCENCWDSGLEEAVDTLLKAVSLKYTMCQKYPETWWKRATWVSMLIT